MLCPTIPSAVMANLSTTTPALSFTWWWQRYKDDLQLRGTQRLSVGKPQHKSAAALIFLQMSLPIF